MGGGPCHLGGHSGAAASPKGWQSLLGPRRPTRAPDAARTSAGLPWLGLEPQGQGRQLPRFSFLRGRQQSHPIC